MTREELRLQEAQDRTAHWKRWGPYLAERQWGTVREDYSPHGTAWDSFPHDHARSRAYRWGEDGLGGITDNHGRLCFALALWNGRDPVLKERLFGLTGSEGNHGEDVKEYYFYLDSTPTHSYMKFLYKYPQAEFPYSRLVEENRRRDRRAPEFELMDTGVFDGEKDAVNPAAVGTKAAARYRMTLAAGQSVAVRLRLANTPIPGRTFGKDFDVVFAQRLGEADEFYATVIPKQLSDDAKSVMRQAFAGLLWS